LDDGVSYLSKLGSPNNFSLSAVTAVTPPTLPTQQYWYHNPGFDRHITDPARFQAQSPRSIIQAPRGEPE